MSEIRTFLHESTHIVEPLVSSVRNEDIPIAGNMGKCTDVPSARKCPVRKIFFLNNEIGKILMCNAVEPFRTWK